MERAIAKSTPCIPVGPRQTFRHAPRPLRRRSRREAESTARRGAAHVDKPHPSRSINGPMAGFGRMRAAACSARICKPFRSRLCRCGAGLIPINVRPGLPA